MTRELDTQEVLSILGISWNTLSNWYRFKNEYPDDPLAKLLPEFRKDKNSKGQKRYWKETDIKKLKEFKEKRSLGRNGQMSKTIQKYYKKEK